MRGDICPGYIRRSDPAITGGRCCCGLCYDGSEMPRHLEDGRIVTEDGHVVKNPERYLRRLKERQDAHSEGEALRRSLGQLKASPYGRGHARAQRGPVLEGGKP